MPRYRKTKRFSNSGEYYEYLRRKRNIKRVIHYETPVLKNPSIAERAAIVSNTHVWKYGDRYYKLAHQYYGNPSYWWVIAWYNGAPTEAHLATGDLIEIPVDIESVMRVLEV